MRCSSFAEMSSSPTLLVGFHAEIAGRVFQFAG